MVSGSGGRTNLSDKDLVESVLRELSEAADKWEALVAQAETVTYSVDLGMFVPWQIPTASWSS